MSLTEQKDDTIGELIPFPNTAVPTGRDAATPVPTADEGGEKPGAVEVAAPVLDGELISEAEYQRSRARRLAEAAVPPAARPVADPLGSGRSNLRTSCAQSTTCPSHTSHTTV